MRRVLPTMIFPVVAASALLAQDSERLHQCMDKANTQLAMNSCANEEAMRADAELDDVYQKLLMAVGKESGAADRIAAAERAWIAYRDAYVEAMYPAKDKQAAYGSIFPTEVDLLRARLARRQTEAIRELLTHYEGQ